MLLIGVKKDEDLGGSKQYFIDQYKALPAMTREEKYSLGLFVIATVLSFVVLKVTYSGGNLTEEYSLIFIILSLYVVLLYPASS